MRRILVICFRPELPVQTNEMPHEPAVLAVLSRRLRHNPQLRQSSNRELERKSADHAGNSFWDGFARGNNPSRSNRIDRHPESDAPCATVVPNIPSFAGHRHRVAIARRIAPCESAGAMAAPQNHWGTDYVTDWRNDQRQYEPARKDLRASISAQFRIPQGAIQRLDARGPSSRFVPRAKRRNRGDFSSGRGAGTKSRP